ncbi:MAG TPA: outer membrane lipoprotein-sorting protein [Bacteroidales bacterium]|nr:outer membrane lipoprotein-sorting protein [Bacteroidales bacterium]
MKTNIMLLACLLISFAAMSQSAREISDKAAKTVEISTFEMAQTLKIIDAKGNERIRETSSKSLKTADGTKTLMVFNAPADVAGTSMLIYDYDVKEDDMWIYLPALRKTRRIVSTEKGQSFMGSEFTNADMGKPNPDDFNYALLAETNVEGVACYSVEMTVKNKDVARQLGYSKKINYIDKTKFVVYKIDHYDASGKLLKTLSLSNYELIDAAKKKYFARNMQMMNHQTKRKSIIVIDNINTKTSIDEKSLSPTMLGAG